MHLCWAFQQRQLVTVMYVSVIRFQWYLICTERQACNTLDMPQVARLTEVFVWNCFETWPKGVKRDRYICVLITH